MARLRRPAVGQRQSSSILDLNTQHPTSKPARSTRRPRYAISDDSSAEESDTISRVRKKKIPPPAASTKTQVRLAPLKSLGSRNNLTIQDDTPEKTHRRPPLDQSPRVLLQKRLSPRKKIARQPSPPGTADSEDEPDEPATSQNALADNEVQTEIDVEESIWCGSDADSSDSDADLPSPSTFFPPRRKQAQQKDPDISKQLQAMSIFDDDVEKPVQKPRVPSSKSHISESTAGNTSDKENVDAIIRFSPPRSKKPVLRDSFDRPSTPPPPPSPSKGKLLSPSKRAPKVPTPPLRPSLDAFWTANAVNEWNDQYSPQKPLRSPKKLFMPSTASEDPSVQISPCKLSPTKRTKAEIQARKDWDTRKISLAQDFLTELDQTITKGQIAALAASTGGVKIIWSKTLNSTAGRANWRRETTKSSSKSEPGTQTITHKHFASIELAEKVLTFSSDAETKLLNVLAHEFSHLANFMISGVKDQPHGASFKTWGRKCSAAFGIRGVQVTTKHSYEIEYKYIWRCEDGEGCGMEFKRHSKSIDPKRHRCGGCRAPLVQIKPVPRGGGGTGGKKSGTPVGGAGNGGTVSGYAAFVKDHFATLKKGMPGATQKEVMEALGKKYRAEKAAKLGSSADVDDVAKKLGSVKLDVREIIDLD